MRPFFLWLVSLAPLLADNTENLSRFAQGVFAETRGDEAQAREVYRETLAADPNCYPLVSKVVGLQKNEDIASATATLRTFVKNNRMHLRSQLDYANFLKRNAPEDAIAQQAALETLELAHQNFPETDVVFTELISHYENNEHRAASLQLLEKQLESTSEDCAHWLALIPIIKTLYPADDARFEKGLRTAMGQLAEHGLHRSDIARRVSEHYRAKGQMKEAIAPLEKHLEISPSSHSLRTRLGLLHLSNQEEERGEKTLLEVIAIDPDQSLAHSSLAKLYTKREETLKALHHRAEVLRIRGGSPADAIEVANEYLDLEKAHEARLLLEKFRFNHPDSPGIHARLAIATLRDGLTQAAARLFRQAETLAEESTEADAEQYLDADFQIEFANSLAEADDLASAEIRLRQAAQGLDLDKEPKKYSRAVTALAKLWLEQEKNEAPARALLERAVMLDPQNQEAASLLE